MPMNRLIRERDPGSLIAALTLSLVTMACTIGPDNAALSPCPEDPLRDEVRTEGHIRILVALEMDLVREGELDDVERARQRQAISDLQDRLLDELRGTDVDVVRRYEMRPQLALRVDEPALCRLLVSELVRALQRDTPEPPAGR
jgi:hypothetical protein